MIITSLKLAIIGNLSVPTVGFIIGCGVIVLVARRALFTVVAAIAGLYLFIKLHGGSTEGEMALFQGILELALVCYGLYLIFRGVFPVRHK